MTEADSVPSSGTPEPEIAPVPKAADPDAAILPGWPAAPIVPEVGNVPVKVKAPRAWAKAHLARARIRKLHRLATAACLAIPGVGALIADIARRPVRVFHFDAPHAAGYWGNSLLVTVMWGALLVAAARRKGRGRQLAAGVFATLVGLAAGVQHAFFWRHNVYAGYDTSLYSASFPSVLVATFPMGTAGTLAILFATVVIALAILVLARLVVRPRRKHRIVAQAISFGLVILAFGVPVSYRANIQSSPPDLIYFHSVARYALERAECIQKPEKPTLVRVQRRFPDELPKLTPAVPTPRNVLFILQESERVDHVCNEYEPACDKPGRFTNDLTPRRFAFTQMRSAASSTAVAVSNLWAGIDPTSSFEVIHKAPLLWDYAHAAGYDTAYWTSQNLIFGNSRLYVQDLPLGHFAGGTNIDPKSDTLIGALDAQLSKYAIKHWDDLKEPFFAVVHYSNLHRPRHVDDNDAPYQPSADKHTKKEEGKNHYKNAVYLSDKAVAKLIEHVRKTEAGKRTIIVYTSDHAEALYEHRNENDHSATVFEEEIHVPAWIDAPEGVLTASEEAQMRRKKDAYLLQYDFAATVMDLLGVWGAPEIAQHQNRVIGAPLTRPETWDRPRPLTNVSWVWEYYLPNWGMMLGSKKVLARAEDPEYLCFDVLKDPHEQAPIVRDPACDALIAAANAQFEILPKDMTAHMRSRQDIWGVWPPLPAP
ncbi:MAG: sulfatase-like hydrolase/transferase [Polyangiaceae bacterium]